MTVRHAPGTAARGPVLRAAPRADREPTCLYFIREPATGHVKIGVSRDPYARLRVMRVDNPSELEVLGLFRVDPFAESDAHYMLRHLRIRGEWYRDAPELRAHIARLAEVEDFRW